MQILKSIFVNHAQDFICVLQDKHLKQLINSSICINTSSLKEEFFKIQDLEDVYYINNIAIINIVGSKIAINKMIDINRRIFKVLIQTNITIFFMIESFLDKSINICISYNDLLNISHKLKKEFSLELQNNLLYKFTTYSHIVIFVFNKNNITFKLLSALFINFINIITITEVLSENKIYVVIHNKDLLNAIKYMKCIINNNINNIDIFIIGVGGIGQALIEQIKMQKNILLAKHINLRICGIANSCSFLINKSGIDLNNWKIQFDKINESFHINKLINLIEQSQFSNPVIIDCTSSPKIASKYVECLKSGFNIVTPNKKANTGSISYYREIRTTAITSHRKFLYETNVGAGLPIIATVQSLLDAGDKIKSFFGILSGSLSFIFGKLDEGMSLSSATLMARKNGYTEPHPRDDLSGIDVARKLLILAREFGYNIELDDIQVESVLPTYFSNIENLDSFFSKLTTFDYEFNNRILRAHTTGKVLRYIGSIEEGYCKVEIKAIDNTHPLYKIKDGENALVFYTSYYNPLPLIIRGYGAGKEVTAAGIFSDLLRTI